MLFRTLQAWYDLFSHGDGRSTEYRQQREKEYWQWRERQEARNRMEDLRHEWKMGRIENIEAPSRRFYETADGYHAARLVEQQRYEDGRSKRFRRNLTEAHEQAEDAEQEAWSETLREAFGDFDKENKQKRIDRLKEELDSLVQPKEEPNWEEINSKPARGWKMSNNGEPYRQMVELRSPVIPKKEVAQEVEDKETVKVERGYFGHVLGDDRLDYPPTSEDELKTLTKELLEADPWETPEESKQVDWKLINEQAKQVRNGRQALQLAEEGEQDEVSDFWLQLAEEYQEEDEGYGH